MTYYCGNVCYFMLLSCYSNVSIILIEHVCMPQAEISISKILQCINSIFFLAIVLITCHFITPLAQNWYTSYLRRFFAGGWLTGLVDWLCVLKTKSFHAALKPTIHQNPLPPWNNIVHCTHISKYHKSDGIAFHV